VAAVYLHRVDCQVSEQEAPVNTSIFLWIHVKKKTIVPRRKTLEKVKVSKTLSGSQGQPFKRCWAPLLEEGSCRADAIGPLGHQQPGAQSTSQTRAAGLQEMYPTLPVYNDRSFLVATDGRSDSSFNHQENFQP